MSPQHAPAPWVQPATKKATVEAVKALLAANDKALIRGLFAIFARQTADEQAGEDVKHNNGVGFTVQDAPFLSSLALQFRTRGQLSPKQMECLRKMMPKYSRQLAEIAIANSKEQACQ